MLKYLVRVDVNEILGFVRDGKDCKLEISEDAIGYILPEEAGGYDDTIHIEHFESYDYEECEDEEEYIDWLKDSFQSELEAKDGTIIKVEI